MDKKLSLLSQLFAITGTEVGAVRTEPSEHSTEDYAQTYKPSSTPESILEMAALE